MTINKRKKNSRQRGSHTHGWGSMKKHRGAGSRGGRGMAGTGKKAGQKLPTMWKIGRKHGKKGFTSLEQKKGKIKTINIKELEDKTGSWEKKGKIKKEGDTYVINLKELGYNVLLSTGNVTKKYKINVDKASEKAVNKIKEKGGRVTVKEEKKPVKGKEKPETEPKQTQPETKEQ